MLTLPTSVHIYLCAHPVDLRRGVDGLAAITREVLLREPLEGHLFVFTNRRRTRVRILAFDGTGYWLMTKRLEAGRFTWPRARPGQRTVSLRSEELAILLAGLDVIVRKRPRWERRSA
ncbi:MAG: IS66 family insertion sequence element accessory protein TnpB [bacterium]|nr:IS66 family insertion sequence element accessory protein TnpB [bacterium]